MQLGELRTFDDVRLICEAAGLERLDPDRWHPRAWFSRQHGVGVAASCFGDRLTGVYIQRGEHPDDGPEVDDGVERTTQLVSVVPRQPGSAAQLASALRIAIGTTTVVGA